MTGCPCGCITDEECIRQRPVLPVEDWPDYSQSGDLHARQCVPQLDGNAVRRAERAS